MSREETLRWKAKIMYHAAVLRKELQLGEESIERQEFDQIISTTISGLLADLQDLFITTLKSLASAEQLEKWLPAALNYQILGCYCQTELGHGSFVKGILTTAVYDKSTDTIEINTPTITATKWWVGALGKFANHAVVFARLIIDGNDFGPHPFMVQLRDLDTHIPLPGIVVGDIGPKMGFNTTDNGYLRLHQVTIPRENMLSQHFSISRDGKYFPAPKPEVLYGAMLRTRAGIAIGCGYNLAKACTIATRYSAVRKQFQKNKDDPAETPVIEYLSQQYRVFPHIATAYGIIFTSRYIVDIMGRLEEDMSVLPEAHISSAGLKSLLSKISIEGIESCRLACGGHGYSEFSGLPSIFKTSVHLNTAEGENWLMTQQTSKFLLKLYNSNQPQSGYLSFMNKKELLKSKSRVTLPENWNEFEYLKEAYEYRAITLLNLVSENLQNNVLLKNMTQDQAWDDQLLNIFELSNSYCLYIVLMCFHEATESISDVEIYRPLRNLLNLYALYYIDQDLGNFTIDNYLDFDQANYVKEQLKAALAQVRKNAVLLVDGFGFSDHELKSALGRFDGDVYPALYKWARSSPLNKGDVFNGFHDYIKPMMNLNQAKL
eukprot:TRINITY_DN6526_c0_g1_i1.p1 TRINITY_DN6526_c0_g1~~TRINITY_DN6526_c0_g1_i1.p1  ORF type:complete len:604 (-),score=113.21 TRINITY_DN6526_c0_g1_i1:15-1826(-)